MEQQIDVQLKELEKVANRLSDHLDSCQTYIKELYTDNLYKIGDAWKNKESYKYINNLTDYLKDLEQYCDSIQKTIAFLKTAKDAYSEALDYAIENAKL
ncbi:MAG: hypothetical protein NC347_14030 [Clostridium sp.]|nr:hypothetical protein [Clostridium sp.]